MTHHLAMILSFGLCTVVGVFMLLGSLTSREGTPDMTAVAVAMGALMLFGLAGLTGELTWVR